MTFLGWSIIFEEKHVSGYKSEKTGDIWFVESSKIEKLDYDNVGVNHISIRVENQSDVDSTLNFLKNYHITALFDTPKHRPEFTSSKDETYYQIMFESPDKILWEIVYIGPKTE